MQEPESIQATIARSARALCSVAPALPRQDRLGQEIEDARQAAQRGYFLPDEDERIRGAFARYLGVRAALHGTIQELEPVLNRRDLSKEEHIRVFTVAFCAACMLMRAARFLIDNFSKSNVVWRKLDEEEPRFGIPRKQFSSVYQAATRPWNVWRYYRAVEFSRDHSEAIRSFASCPDIGEVVALLEHEHPEAIRISKRAEAKNRLRYWLHSLRRRRNSTLSQMSFAIFEASGRTISELGNPFHRKRVAPGVVRAARKILQPGDAIVTRHDDAMSNLFLPGYWPHGALYIGTAEQRRELGVSMTDDRWRRSGSSVRVLEARKDGVQFRSLSDTLHVDAFTILRPELDAVRMAEALTRAAEHEGKYYDFEFDFNRADRLVCTEVIYRGFHMVGNLQFPLKQRAGRPTFSAEDLLDLALDGHGYKVVAVFGENGNDRLLEGPEARIALARTYRSDGLAGESLPC
jgi:hypothetical protein